MANIGDNNNNNNNNNNNMVDLSKRKEWRMNDILTFGKYKGETIAKVVGTNPKYLIWARNTIDWFELSEVALAKAEEAVESNRQRQGSYIIDDDILF